MSVVVTVVVYSVKEGPGMIEEIVVKEPLSSVVTMTSIVSVVAEPSELVVVMVVV